MDYQFIRNDYNEPEAIFSEGHLALGHFLTTELAGTNTINELRCAIVQLQTNQIEVFEWLGKEYKLVIEKGDVSITALVLDHDFDDEDLPESTQLYDDEQKSECGLLDFNEALEDWLVFSGE